MSLSLFEPGPSRRRRGVSPCVLLVVLALLAAACGTQGDDTTADPAPGTGDATADPAEPDPDVAGGDGGTFIQAIFADPSGLNPAITTSSPDLYAACKAYEALVRFDANYEVQPYLARSWDIADDGLTYTFHLEEDVRWHDGEPFTAHDVVFSLGEISANYGPRISGPLENMTSISAADDHTVVLELSEPFGPLLTLLSCANAAILPRHVFEGEDPLDHPMNTEGIVGTGAYRFDEWVRGSHIRFVRNDDYWQEGLPYLDTFILRVMDDPAAAASALEAGEVDFIPDNLLDKSDYIRLVDRDEFLGGGYHYTPSSNLLILNVREEPFDDVLVRRAVFHAIDREFIVDQAEFGMANPGKSAIDTRLGWPHNPDVDYMERYPYDPETAQELLDEAGYTPGDGGIRFEIDIPYESGQSAFQATADVLRENLAAVGIRANLVPVERSVMLERVFENWDFGAYLTQYTSGGEVTVGVQRLYLCSTVGTNHFNNASGYCNEEVDELFRQGAMGATPEERAPYYFEVQEILADDVPTLVLNEAPKADLASADYEGYWTGNDAYDWWELVRPRQ